MVVVNLYAFEKTAAKPGVAFEELIENIDIGGPSMIRSAAKNFQDVAIVTSPADYDSIADELQRSGGALSRETKWRLAQKAFATTAAYDSAIASTLERVSADSFQVAAGNEQLSDNLRFSFHKTLDLRYGENPHQKAAMYSDGSGVGVANARQLQGKELSYNNIVDLQAAWDLAQEFAGSGPVRHHQAHQPLRHCDRQDARRGLQTRARMRSRLGFRRRDRREPSNRRRSCRRNAQTFPRSDRRPGFDEAAKAKFASKKNLRLVEVVAGEPEVGA